MHENTVYRDALSSPVQELALPAVEPVSPAVAEPAVPAQTPELVLSSVAAPVISAALTVDLPAEEESLVVDIPVPSAKPKK